MKCQIMAVLTKPCMSKNARKHLFPYRRDRPLICVCENPGLLNQSDTEVKAMEENLRKLLDNISCRGKLSSEIRFSQLALCIPRSSSDISTHLYWRNIWEPRGNRVIMESAL